MKVSGCLVVAITYLALVQGGRFLRDDQEFEYKTEIRVGTGTMDYAPHLAGSVFRMKSRVQTSNNANTFNVELSNVQVGEYVGGMDPSNMNTDGLTFKPIPKTAKFQVNLNDDGTFKNFKTDATEKARLNVMKAWASLFQIKKSPENTYVSKGEKTVQGDCDVKYVVTPNAIYKSVVHVRDCKNRPIRVRNDWGGFSCDYKNRKEKMDGLVSSANTIFSLEKDGSFFKMKEITAYGAIVAQMFETEGVSHLSIVNATHTLVDDKASSGNINPSGRTYNSIAYEFEDSKYQWDANPVLKEKEPFFSSGEYLTDATGAVSKATFKKMIATFLTTLDTLEKRDGVTKDSLIKAHKNGINRLAIPIFAMDYNTLKAMYQELKSDTTALGVKKSNIFNELLGAAGSSPAAVLVTELVAAGSLNDRDGGRMFSSIPYHIRFPTKKLTDEMFKLLTKTSSMGSDKRFTKMAIPLTLGHMVRQTCERAGGAYDWDTKKSCAKTYAKVKVQEFKALYDSAAPAEKSLYLNAISNIKWGVYDTLKTIIKDPNEETDNRVLALWGSFMDLIVSKQGKDLPFELYANNQLDHELRIAAVQMIFYANPSSTDLASVVAVLRNEKDYELINFVFALMERWATDIEPCSKKTSELAAYFLKYLKQLTGYKTDWGFGVSKTYKRTFVKEKYGYSGSYTFMTMGAHQSTTPLGIGMEIDSTLHHDYRTSLVGIYLRVEGLAKGLIRKFKTMDPAIWKTGDLANILSGQMGIAARPEQPIKVSVTIMYKRNVVIHRKYDSSSAREGGNIQSFLKKIKDLGSNYAINHQRVLPVGSVVVEQPNIMGVPTAYIAAITTMADIDAKVTRGNTKGLQFREVKYDIKLFTQGMNGMSVRMPGTHKRTYLVNQDRIYYAHFPREVLVGVNLIKKQLKLKIGRPEHDHPLSMLMHSVTYVAKREQKMVSSFNDNPANTVVVTKGREAVRDRVFLDLEDTTQRGHGFHAEGKYFDCEMDVARRNTMGRGLAAFMPYNKYPKTPWTMFSMGMRQIRAFFIFFPKAQRCGARFMWSQSKTKPVKKIEIEISGKKGTLDKSLDRGFFRASNMLVKIQIVGRGETKADNRGWLINIQRKGSAGNVDKLTTIEIKKKFPSWVTKAAKSGCLKARYEAKYPDFSQEFFGLDLNTALAVTGKVSVEYGANMGKKCTGPSSGKITVDFNYKTTIDQPQAKRELLAKSYTKSCIEQKKTNAWKNRPATAYPFTKDCFKMIYDATVARDYLWDIKFEKLTDDAKSVIKKIRTVVQFVAMTLKGKDLGYDEDAVELDPRLRIHAVLKDNDELADITLENARLISQGKKHEIKDYSLKLDWGPRMLRNLKFGGLSGKLIKMGIIKPCVATSTYVQTMDDVSYSYTPDGCWTLISAHCAAAPSYAVFTKYSGGKLIMEAYLGGHKIEINGASLKIDGRGTSLGAKQLVHKEQGKEIFSIYKWGSTYSIYSFLKVWIVFDGSFVEVTPAPSVKGNHCGMCGNYNRNKHDEFTKKDGVSLAASAAQMVSEYQWKC